MYRDLMFLIIRRINAQDTNKCFHCCGGSWLYGYSTFALLGVEVFTPLVPLSLSLYPSTQQLIGVWSYARVNAMRKETGYPSLSWCCSGYYLAGMVLLNAHFGYRT